MLEFYGRDKELKIIKEFLNMPFQANLLLYGRRRIGKSYLISKSLENSNLKIINYQCKDVSLNSTLADLNELLRTNLNIDYLNFNNIDKILDYIFSLNDIVFVLDEYPYLINRITGINSIIQQKIDIYNKISNMKFIVSGSSIDIMQNLVDYSNPLFGRFDKIIKLEEQNYLDSQLFYPNFSNEDKVKLYSVFGGEPYINKKIDNKEDFTKNLIKLAIEEGSILELMINSSILNEVKKISLANDVILSIAVGKHKNKEIADLCGVESAKIDYILNKLIMLGIIEKAAPINDLDNKRKFLYYIKNNDINVYYRYIYKNLSFRNSLPIDVFYKKYIEKDFLE